MESARQIGRLSREAGSALLIAIFALLLISVVGLALVVSTGTDSALAGNYRNSTGAYYAAVAGMEEARGRLLWKNPDYLNKTGVYSAFFSPQGMPTFGLNDVIYIVNPAGGETVDPTDGTSPYADTEYATEMGGPPSTPTIVTSVSQVAGLPGPAYKWVRINPVTEKAMGIDVNNSGGTPNSSTALFYDGGGLNLTSLGSQALGITAFVVMPDNSKRLLQYVVVPNLIQSIPPSPSGLNIDFPAALTLAGNNVGFVGPGTGNSFPITGQDQTPACSSNHYMVAAIGYTNSTDNSYTTITAGALPATDYKGSPLIGWNTPSPAPASIQNVSTSMNSNWMNPLWLEANVVQNTSVNADVIINGNATGNDIQTKAPAMGPLNPMTIVVNGNLDLSSWYGQGYGLLLVTGTLNYSTTATWRGLILVVGQGMVTATMAGGSGEIDGAVFVAQTRDASNNILGSLGASSFTVLGAGNATGIGYNSCWIHGTATSGAQGPLNFKILSFREISQ